MTLSFLNRRKRERVLDRRLEDLEGALSDLRKEVRDLSDDLEYTQTAIARLRGTITGGRRGSPPAEAEEPSGDGEGFDAMNRAIKEERIT